ncbi:GNAT family N-acetyltransferase [Psychromicrobium xiongbiense]|uniref:GNAT family N-acetyltransferase n=1 Tax=Psychromicrobium xiongbiense TaxID=3051184 RepID=UPI00255645C6|nr:GNAT family N-acetyltransferase [Psychromicrobium sp. YIM S02556]
MTVHLSPESATTPEDLVQTDLVPVLSDGTVTLRALTLADVPGIVRNCRDDQAQRWISRLPLDYGESDAVHYLTEIVATGWRDGSTQDFAVADASDEGLLGTIGLHAFRAGTAELGINLGPASRGRGVGSHAVALLLDYAFNGLNLEYLYWFALAPHWASRKLAEKSGFRFEAELRGFADHRGTSAAVWMLSQSREEYLSRVEPRTARLVDGLPSEPPGA